MKPFNLEEALAGARVVTRDGREVTQLIKADGMPRLIGTLDEDPELFNLDGTFSDGDFSSDLFLLEEHWTPTMELRWEERLSHLALQQKWIAGSGNANEPFKIEWRDIPTVEDKINELTKV